MAQTNSLDRRKFLKLSGMTGAGLVIGLSTRASALGEILASGNLQDTYQITPYVFIEPSGAITLMNPKPDMGQGTFQSIPALLAEELEVNLDQVTILQTGGEAIYGHQVSGGSDSVRGLYFSLRKVGATAREMLISAGAKKWQVPASECYAQDARVIHRPSGKSLSYGELAASAASLQVPQDPVLKDPKDFRILGKSYPRPDVPLKVTGKPVFGIDMEVPGMVFASVEVNPILGSKLMSTDDSESRKIPGVLDVLPITRKIGIFQYDGVAVVAENYWAALQGRRSLKLTWDPQGMDQFNSKDYEQGLRDLAARQEGYAVANQGDFDGSYSSAPVKLEAFYETPIVAHAPMEPMNCLARWNSPDQLEIWASSQGPDLLKYNVAGDLNLSPDQIKVHILFSGGGFGRRLMMDFASEAAFIARKVSKPVKLIWTREDDTQLGPFRPMTFSSLKAGLSTDGLPLAFQHKVISPSLSSTRNPNASSTQESSGMTEGISSQDYELPNMKNTYVFSEIKIPLGPWRSVTSSTLAFAHESFLDEMAVKAGKDPMEFRLGLLKDDTLTHKLLTRLRDVSGWGKPLAKGWGRGVAQYKFFAGIAGYVVEVSSSGNGAVKIEKVYAAIDMGTVVNPDTVKAQVEGAMVMALTAATKAIITFEGGHSVQTNFNNYPILRISDMPPIEVHIIADGGPVIRGAGEPGVPSFAPALTNAIYAATGKRIRRLPFDLNHV